MKIEKDDFDKFLEKKFNPKEIAEIHRQAEFEAIYLHQIQKIISATLDEYTQKNNVKLDDIAEKLGWSISKIQKLQKGSYNLSIPDFGYFLSRLEKNPTEIFNIKN
jgi:hypothetical protein